MSSNTEQDQGLVPGQPTVDRADEGVVIDEIRDYWNRNVDDWKIATHEPGAQAYFEETEHYRFEKLDYLSAAVSRVTRPGKRLLDIGCGLGNDTSRFAQSGMDVVGVDIAPRAIELSQKNFAQRGLSGEFFVSNGEALDFPDEVFDVVYCHTVLQFTANPERMTKEIYRVMKPGGIGLIMVINKLSWLRFLHRTMKVEIDYLDAPAYRWFSRGEFAAMLARFSDVDIVAERFPTRTKIHGGIKAKLFNTFFVDLYNLAPRTWVEWSAHHLLAYVRK